MLIVLYRSFPFVTAAAAAVFFDQKEEITSERASAEWMQCQQRNLATESERGEGATLFAVPKLNGVADDDMMQLRESGEEKRSQYFFSFRTCCCQHSLLDQPYMTYAVGGE